MRGYMKPILIQQVQEAPKGGVCATCVFRVEEHDYGLIKHHCGNFSGPITNRDFTIRYPEHMGCDKWLEDKK